MKTKTYSLFLGLLCSAFSFSLTAKEAPTKTPIRHLVIIFQENRTFDHYFGTYPHAQNNPGETKFKPRQKTPGINGLSKGLLLNNQNLAQPFRLTPYQGANDINDPDHNYTPLQQALNSGLMDKFVEACGQTCTPPEIVMGYYDGNTVTALWNYAQYFAMSDNFHSTNIGQSSVGAINLISGQVHGTIPTSIPGYIVDATLINDLDPFYDTCSAPPTFQLTGINVGNLLNQKQVTWGFFQGGFADCNASHIGAGGAIVQDYVPHHNPFQYYQSTANPTHLPPSSLKMIGKNDQANHIYDLKYFWAAAEQGNVPAVSYLRASAYQDGHPGYSTPILEQEFLVNTINRLQKLPQWKDMAIIIAFDDSGGWYDHEMSPIINQSQIPEDALTGPGNAGSNPPLGGYQGRPAYGLRLPFILISPWAKENYVDSRLIDQTSILRFIEDNWNLGRIGNYSFDALAGSIESMFDFEKPNCRTLLLNPKNGTIIHQKSHSTSIPAEDIIYTHK